MRCVRSEADETVAFCRSIKLSLASLIVSLGYFALTLTLPCCLFQDGLRYLLNMLSLLPIVVLDSNDTLIREDEDTHRQTARTACQVLKK